MRPEIDSNTGTPEYRHANRLTTIMFLTYRENCTIIIEFLWDVTFSGET